MVEVTIDACEPSNEQTQRIQKLIGKRLTKVRAVDGEVTFEFDPWGKITMSIFQDIYTSILPPDHILHKLPVLAGEGPE